MTLLYDTTMAFTGFDRRFFTFLKQLKANNNREWFAANKARYQEDVEAPALAFIADFAPKLKAISPLVQVIMLTGDANLVTVLESLENGAIDFVPKARDYASLLPPVIDALSRVDRWMPLMKSRR